LPDVGPSALQTTMNTASRAKAFTLAHPTPKPLSNHVSLQLRAWYSESPYGRTHVWKRRPPKLPNPVVPMFPQRVMLADGSTYTHWTTSPKSAIRLTRDTTNNPTWNPAVKTDAGAVLEEEQAGRMGRFRRKFGVAETSMDVNWNELFEEGEGTAAKGPATPATKA